MPLAHSFERVPLQHREDRDGRKVVRGVYQGALGIFISGRYLSDFQRKRLALNGRIN